MAICQRMAPAFPVTNVAASLAFYERLGFATRVYDGSHEYGFATRDGVELHVGVSPREWTPTTAYLFVDDADAFAAEWRAAGIEVHGPEDTEWGRHEGAVVDPDGNVIRFGNAINSE